MLSVAVKTVLDLQKESAKPLAVILAGHNGSGKSTLWYSHLADKFQIPLVNADRMMLSILPEIQKDEPLPQWATDLRDNNQSWMSVAQKGVEAFVAQAMLNKVNFAQETVFSHWKENEDGVPESKIDLIHQLHNENYFVLLLFVGLANRDLSIARVQTRKEMGGHDVDYRKLVKRFPRTQKAVSHAVEVADAAVLFDNSFDTSQAFTVVRIQLKKQILFDLREDTRKPTPGAISEWLDVVCPRH